MSINFQTTPNNAKVTVLSDDKFRLIGDPVNGGNPKRPPELIIDFQQNYPRFRVKLNNGERDQEARQIDLNLDVMTVSTLVQAIDEISRKPEKADIVIAVKRQKFDQGTRKFTEPYTYGFIIAGKDMDGCMYLGVIRGSNENAKNYLKVKFHFIEPEFHPILDRTTMQPADRSAVSCLIARGWCNLMRSYVPLVHANIWDYSKTPIGKWEAQKAGNGGNNGGGNNQNNNWNNNGNRNQNQSSPREAPVSNGAFDDDIPF